MNKASEYRKHAAECRKLAANMSHPEDRQRLLDMSEQWEKLAAARVMLIARYPELALPDETTKN